MMMNTKSTTPYDASASMGSNLRLLEGSLVGLRLNTGLRLEGTVQQVGTHVVCLRLAEHERSSLTGEEFQEFLVQLDAIVAVARPND
jgi:hypothetical protein